MTLRSIDTRIANRLKSDKEFRQEWYRAELEQGVPELFRELREYRGLTQAELAQKVGMRQSAVSRFEKSSEPNWKFETLLRIADALDAQLVVGLEKSEDVIKRYEYEERNCRRESLRYEASMRAVSQYEMANYKKGSIDEIAQRTRKHDNVTILGGQFARGAQSSRRSVQASRSLSV